MAKNTGVLGVAAILLIFTAKEHGNRPDGAGPSGHIFRPVDPGALLNDLHKMAEMVNKMDRLGQMALHPPELPKLPSGDIFGGDTSGGNGAMPDLTNIMENLGPLMAAFGQGAANHDDHDNNRRYDNEWHDVD